MSIYPHDVAAEKALCACALIDPDTALPISQLPRDLFTSPVYKAIHEAVQDAVNDNVEPDLVTLPRYLAQHGKLAGPDDNSDSLVTSEDLAGLMDTGIVPAQWREYARLLKTAHQQRQILKSADHIRERAQDRLLTPAEMQELLEDLQQTAFELTVFTNGNHGRLRAISSFLSATLATIEARHDGKISPFGTEFGFRKLDRSTTGVHPGQVTTVAARPGMGKTSFALDVALHASKAGPVYFFSLEMSAEEIAQRLIAKQACLNIRDVRTGQVLESAFSKLVKAAGEVSEHALSVDDSSTVSPVDIRSRVRQLAVQEKESPVLLVVDYLQIMSPSRSFNSREREVASISREMKAVAKDLRVPVILLSQLNRELEKRADKRPILSDLRESGAIEQDADIVIGLYRPHPYTGEDEDRTKAEVIILKQRSGPIGSIPLYFTPETATFHDPL